MPSPPQVDRERRATQRPGRALLSAAGVRPCDVQGGAAVGVVVHTSVCGRQVRTKRVRLSKSKKGASSSPLQKIIGAEKFAARRAPCTVVGAWQNA